ncbi:coiled-coil domain-containing protein 186-like, partial [Oryzias melastigma]
VSSSSEPSPVDSSGSSGSPSSVQSTSKNSFTDSSTTSGICNGPSTPSSPASSPHTQPDHLHSASSPFDTDCSRKLISQIQRTLSQESLLDELESELLNCQLLEGVGERKRKGSPPVNGLPTDQKGCMVTFEKCVQDKCTKQEKAIQRLLEENKRHQELI